MKPNGDTKITAGDSGADLWLEVVRREVSALNFGVVQIVVHGAQVVQIECTKKIRLENPIALSNRGDY